MWEKNENEEDPPVNRNARSAIKWILLLAATGLLLTLAMCGGLPGTGSGGDSPAIGKTPARLSLRSAADDTSLQLADLEGQVVFINFWGPWCHFCLEEMPHLKVLFDQRRERKDFRFLSVTCQPGGQNEGKEFIEESRDYLQRKEMDFPLYTDPAHSTRQALADLDREAMGGYPSTVVLDQKGVVRGVWVGYTRGSDKEMGKLLDQLLNTK